MASLHLRREDVFSDPAGTASRVLSSGAVFGLTAMEVRFATRDTVVYWLTLEPWLGPAAEGYPVEEVAITIHASGDITAVPRHARERRWLHRNPAAESVWWGSTWRAWYRTAPQPVQQAAIAHARTMGDPRLLGDLCLWYPGDPRSLRWAWSDGLVSYITIVHRHLQAEECWRRTGSWPAEDAPHGRGRHGITTNAMRTAAGMDAA